MRKILFVTVMLLSTLQAITLEKVASYALAQEQAMKKNKHIMVLITTEQCRYCIKMKKTTFTIPKVIERIAQDYIFIEVDRDFDTYPEYLTVYGVPTTYFLYNDGKPIMRGVGGYWNTVDFLSFMDDADRAIKKHNKE